MMGRFRILAAAGTAAIILAGCGGGEGMDTAPEDIRTGTEAEAPGNGGDAESGGHATIETNGTTVTIEALGEVSFLNLVSERAGHAAIRTATCESPGELVVDFGELSPGESLASQVDVKFEELTGGGYVLTIGDSCVGLQPT